MNIFSSVLLVFMLYAVHGYAAPLDSSFTYQGELRVGGTPANGPYDFQFELFDAVTSGTLQSSPVLVENVVVTDGVFSVELNFGASTFDGQNYWLEIGVREGASSGGYQGLAPRQKVTPAPYALHALNAESVNSAPAHDHIGEYWSGTEDQWILQIINTLDPDVANGSAGGLRVSSDSDFASIYGLNSDIAGTGEGIYGASNGTGAGVSAYSRLGPAIYAASFSGTNIIEAYDRDSVTTNLRFRVSLAGNVYADGSFTGGGADVAEFIDHHGTLEPGDVVAIAPDGLFDLVREAGSTAVAGVITSAPGLLMNANNNRQTLNDAPAMALAGRLPVKVTNEGGIIKPGDLLIASSTPGHAMRAPEAPKPGTVIGKALGRMDSVSGKVEMLVMLR